MITGVTTGVEVITGSTTDTGLTTGGSTTGTTTTSGGTTTGVTTTGALYL